MKWTFTSNDSSYSDLKENDEIKWNSAKEVKKGEIILFYTGKPHSSIEFIFTAKTEPFEDETIRNNYNAPAIFVHNKITIPDPITLEELKANSILKEWGAVRFNFRRSHWKMSDEEWIELKKLIIEHNPHLESKLNLLTENIVEEDDLNNNFSKKSKIWKITPGEGLVREDLWKLFKKDKVIGIGWFGDKADYSQFHTLNDLKKGVLDYYGEPKDATVKMIWYFTHDLKKGDIIVANSGQKGVLGIGIIKSDYIGPKNPENPTIHDPSKRNSYKDYVHFRKVTWLLDDEINFNNPIFDQKTITPINEDKWNKIKEAYINKNKDYAGILNKLKFSVDEDNILKIIENPQEIKEAQDKFLEIMYNYADEVIPTEKFDLGPKIRVEVHWSNKLGIYFINRVLEDPSNRYMNAFGIQKPDVNFNLPVVCEINIPKDGINRNVQGAFAKDLEENVYLIHRGNIGGKHPKAEFFDKYSGETAQIQEGNTVTDVIVIGYLNPKLPEKVKNFVFEVAKIKGLNTDKSPKPSQNTGYKVIKELFKEYNESFLNTQMGKDHLLAYESYCKDVHKTFNTIMNDPEVVNDISDPIINYLLPIKGKPIAPAAVGSIKAFGYTDEVIPGLTETVFELINDLNNTNDKIQQKKLIAEFKNGPFSKGFQTAMLSPVLYCINKQYWLYNKKTVQTFNLLSEILGENNKIDGFLDKYIDNLDKLTNLVEDISVYIPEFSDFKVFDAFCHWMCDPKLGYYAMDREKYAEWLKINFPEEPKIDNTPGTFAEFLVDKGYYFEPEMIENFLLSFKAKRFVILTGNSGTGKTKIAQLFAQYVSNSMVKNSSITTKVKVGKATKNKGWTLKKDVLKDFGIPNINGSYDIKIDGVKGKGNLYMLSQLFYANDNGIQSKLKDLEINDPDQKIDLEIILPSNEGFQYKIVPVGANWTENRHIIGFYNVITNEYITSDALELILEASKPENKDKPFFLILDEMNLSHVERYFADFLSAMESDEYISLHKSNDKIGYPNDIKIPKNLFVIGTVNVDETTYMFSPKVLDRANVIEFSTISAKDYMLNGVTQDQLTGNVNYLENPLYKHNLVKSLSESRIENFRSYLENVETLEGNKLWDLISDELNIFQKVLKTAGFDFGFRLIDEVLRFMYVAWYYEGENEIWDNWQRYFDAQIKQKMLPRIHGSQRVLENTLNELSQLCVDYPTSKAKIEEMKDVLYKQRYVSFTN